MGYTGRRANYCRDAADCLASAFVFEGSPEGKDFWTAVYNRLAFLARGENFDTPLNFAGGAVAMLQVENKRLSEMVALREKEIDSQAQTINDLRKRLRLADFCNLPGPRSGGFT